MTKPEQGERVRRYRHQEDAMHEDDSGNWVRYTSIAAKDAQIAELRQRLSTPAHDREPPHCPTCMCKVQP